MFNGLIRNEEWTSFLQPPFLKSSYMSTLSKHSVQIIKQVSKQENLFG